METTGAAVLLTATETGPGSYVLGAYKSAISVFGSTSAGVGAAEVNIEVSNDPTQGHWLALATITLTLGTTAVGEGFVTDAPWGFVRANVVSISGTDATVTVTRGA
jgi:hypothetical protein